MSLSEFTKLGKRKEERASHVSTLPSHGSDSEFFELVWQNGQIMMQAQSNKTIEGPIPNERDPRVAKFSSLDPVLNDFPLSAPSYEPSLDQEDDTVPWLNSHPTDFPCSKDISGVTGLNNLRFSDTCPLPRSRDSDITQCQSGAAKDSTASKLHKFDTGQSSESLVNFPYFSRFASIPVSNDVKLDSKKDTFVDQSLDKAVASGEKAHDPAMATSSVCSANRFERASNDPTYRLKRKFPETGDLESCSNEVEEESIALKKASRGRKGSKRNRASEVHNLSERRRREKINERMRALQELLPNCNKVDKASMLDEAIEYLKALQLQVQVLSMGAAMCMQPMMLPSTMQPMHRAHTSQFLPMGVGMGMGFGIGMNDLNYSMAQTPNTHGPNLTQELPISMPCAPLPFSEIPHIRLPGVADLPPLAPSVTSREALENFGSQVILGDQEKERSQDSD